MNEDVEFDDLTLIVVEQYTRFGFDLLLQDLLVGP